jgi:hypothetical protein
MKSAKRLDAQICARKVEAVIPNSFTYLAPLSIYKYEKPYLSRLPSLPGFARSNIKGKPQAVQIFEVSGHEHVFNLDSSGFEFTHFSEPLQDWTDSTLCTTYIPKMTIWLKDYLGCAEVHIYAYSVS